MYYYGSEQARSNGGSVRATGSHTKAERLVRRPGRVRRALGCAVATAAIAGLLSVTGCTPAKPTNTSETTPTVGAHMAGAVIDVNVTPDAIADKPKAAVLSTPEDAVRSYLDWTSYAYRTAQSDAALPTMSNYEEVRVDSYVQYNLQQSRVIDQSLDSITFGKTSTEGTRTLVPTHETWTYRYVSVKTAGKTLEGPYKASYDATYTVIQKSKGTWVVDSVQATSLNEVK